MDIENVRVLFPLLLFLSLWELVWKSIALWRSARNNDKYWYIALLIFNTVGILPILYIILKKKKDE